MCSAHLALIGAVPLAGAVGAEVSGLDLATPFTDDVKVAVRELFVEHQVLVFRSQELTGEQQIAFGEQFGELDVHPFVEGSVADPRLLDVVTEVDDQANFGGGWHTDLTFLPEPDLGSILYALEVPPFGGDTLFASQTKAYDALSDRMKEMLEGLVAVHSAELQYGAGGKSTLSKAMKTKNQTAAYDTVEHPVIRTHPESGRKSLYVNRAFTLRIRSLRPHESSALLEMLYTHAVKERFTCRVRWEPGTLVMWDNRSVQHYALHDYAGHRRHMRRVTVKGDRPV